MTERDALTVDSVRLEEGQIVFRTRVGHVFYGGEVVGGVTLRPSPTVQPGEESIATPTIPSIGHMIACPACGFGFVAVPHVGPLAMDDEDRREAERIATLLGGELVPQEEVDAAGGPLLYFLKRHRGPHG